MPAAQSPRCPACQARFRRQRTCTRCGADLTILMRLAGQSWLARQAARAALRTGNLDAAQRLAGHAQQLCDTPTGQSLLAFTTCAKRVVSALGNLTPT